MTLGTQRGCQGLRGDSPAAAAAARKRWGRLQSLLAALPIRADQSISWVATNTWQWAGKLSRERGESRKTWASLDLADRDVCFSKGRRM